MKAISLQQPWASIIVDGPKRIENRSRNFVGSYRGPVLIHASKYRPKERELVAIADFMRSRGLFKGSAKDALQLVWTKSFGGIIGRAVITDVVTISPDPWFFGTFGIMLEQVEPLPFFPCRGMLGLFQVEYPESLLLQAGKEAQ